jgi:hypothetical protein
MKLPVSEKNHRALTLDDALVAMAVLALLGIVLLAPYASVHSPRKRMYCVGNLKQVGVAFRLWADDNGDKYPAFVSVTNGGTMELVSSGSVFPHYQVMSNELCAPRILVCPQDRERTAATNFDLDFIDGKISYFVGVDADATNAEMLLAGDRNTAVGGVQLKHGLASLATNSPVGWSKKMHSNCGNVALADGSVHQTTSFSLRARLERSGVTNRLAIP